MTPPAVEDVDIVLLDLDGTVYEGSRVVPGAPAAIGELRDRGLAVRFATNTDSVAPGPLAERLAGMGIPAAAEELLTPVALAVELFRRAPESRVLAVASAGVRAELARFLVGPDRAPTHVLVADPSFGATYDDLDTAFRALRAGAELVATQVNRIVRRDDGEHLDTGGWVRLLEYAAGVEARVLGKPSPEFFRLALDAAGVPPERALVVGDDRAADVAGGRSVGARAVLVRTGKGATQERGSEGVEPDAVVDSLADLPRLLGGGGGPLR